TGGQLPWPSGPGPPWPASPASPAPSRRDHRACRFNTIPTRLQHLPLTLVSDAGHPASETRAQPRARPAEPSSGRETSHVPPRVPHQVPARRPHAGRHPGTAGTPPTPPRRDRGAGPTPCPPAPAHPRRVTPPADTFQTTTRSRIRRHTMKAVNPALTSGFVLADDDGEPFWFLNTLTITKVGAGHSQGQLSIVDHRMPPGFAPPPHIHQQTDEALLVLHGQLQGFCGDSGWNAGPGSLVFLPRA